MSIQGMTTFVCAMCLPIAAEPQPATWSQFASAALDEQDESAFADPECYACRGSGKIQGFGCDGLACSCVPHCVVCDAAFGWARDDERPPRLCPNCEAQS